MSVRKKGLGSNAILGSRLQALGLKEKKIDEIDKAASGDGTMPAELDISAIVPNPHQARREFDSVALEELSSSIRQYGLIQPLVVQKKPDGTYELVAGERRLRAAKLAGLKTIPALVREYTPDAAAEVSLIENLQRENLNVMEEAAAYDMLIHTFGLTQEEAAQKVGKSRPHVANMIRLLKLPDEICQFLRDGTLSMGQARPLLQFADEDQQLAAAGQIIRQGLSARQCEALVARMLQGGTDKGPKEPDAYLEAMQDRIKMHLGTNVSIHFNRKRQKGKIEISVASEAEFERLLALLTEEKTGDGTETPSSFTV